MSELKRSNLKKDLFTGELLKIEYSIGDDPKSKMLDAERKLRQLRI